ncbi:MAG TPA: glycosyltransferase [Pyrinomonadaceae bacterium]|nr:glycosyltransferase [Pyrinomonadaceae bacterium]
MGASQQNTSGERMRVLRISHASLTPSLRERERALARGYADVDLEVLTTERWREAEVNVEATDDDLFPVTKARTRFSKHIQLFAYDPRPIISALRRHRPHLIDLNHEPYSVACAEVLTLCNWFAPSASVVLQIAQNIFRRYPPPFEWLQQRALRRVNAAYACNQTARELLRARGFDKPLTIIPFGVNTEAFHPRRGIARIAKAPLTIGFVGRMLPGKGLNILADALSKLASESWRLMIVGDGPEREGFGRALAASGLLDRAEFAGAVGYESVSDFYRHMDILVVPTQTTKRIREQFGRVIVEAMSSGVPVIGSTCGAIPEVIDRAGLVVPEGDADALASALRRLLLDGDLRNELARAGRERVERHYSWERVADKTYDLFRQVLQHAPARSLNPKLEFVA